ncbi:MAG: hypothetical protein IJ192_11925 [Clostridia bacterium]|nr:hypothetical protein [Clostridia bacterium]
MTLKDIYGNAFFILWKDGKFSVEPYEYHDYNVCITAPQRNLELLFTERQYLFMAHMNKEMNIKGSFEDVMAFHKLLSYFTKDSFYVVQEEIISNMLLKQDMLQSDLGMIMEALQLLLTNSLLDMPVSQEVNKSDRRNFSVLKAGDVLEFGHWEGESIQWIVLKKCEDSLFVISRKILAKKAFHSDNIKVSWGKSDLYKWLHTSFYDHAFDVEEKQKIKKINHKNQISVLNINDAKKYTELIKGSRSRWWTYTSTAEDVTKKYVVTKSGTIADSGVDLTNEKVGIRPTLSILL